VKPVALHLLRHGAPLQTGLLMGHTDGLPDPQASGACTLRVEGLELKELVCSDLVRAREPAEAIARARGLPLRVDPRWREMNFGEWDGLRPDTLNSETLAAFWDDPDANPPAGGERWSALLMRVGAALDDVGGGTLVVCHAGAIRAALCCLLGLSYRHAWGFDLPYAALVSLNRWPGEPRLAQITGLGT
jgi:alpha-ribazole phosphatase